MTDRELLLEVFKRLGQNFYEVGKVLEVPKTDSQVAADALQETLFNMGFDEGIHYSRIESFDEQDCWECRFEIKEVW